MKKSKLRPLTEQERKERNWRAQHGLLYRRRPEAIDLKKKLVFDCGEWLTVAEFRELLDTEDNIKLAEGNEAYA